MQNSNPLIVQGDKTLLLDIHAPQADECRRALIPFAELERSPEHLHTYRLTPLSLWNAASAGFSPDYAVDVLKTYSRFDVPQPIIVWIRETASRFAFRFGRGRYADFGNAVACRIPRTGSEQKTVKISAAPARVCAARRDNRKTRKYG